MSANVCELGLLALLRLALGARRALLIDGGDVFASHAAALDDRERSWLEAVAARASAGEAPLPAADAGSWRAFVDHDAQGAPAVLLLEGGAREGEADSDHAMARVAMRAIRAERDEAQASAATRHFEAVLAGIEMMAEIGMWQLDMTTGRVTWSDVTYAVHGVTRETFTPTLENALSFYPEEVQGMVRSSIGEAIKNGTGFSFVLPFIRADNELRTVRSVGTVIRGAGGDHIYGIFQDISEMKQAELRLWWTANHDPLTGLPNRMLFQERLDAALLLAKQHGQSVGLILVDLDHFKAINDVYGHEAGDQLLARVAKLLTAHSRQGDTVARLGGDEFAIIVNGLSAPDEIAAPLERLLTTAETDFVYRDIPIPVKLSMGAAVYPRDAQGEDELYRNADIALFRSKANPKKRGTLYDPSHGAERDGHEAALRRIREAIAAGAITAHYQPIFDLGSGGIAAVDVLARWRGSNDPTSAEALRPAFEDPELAPRIGLLMLSNLRRGWCELPHELRRGMPIAIKASEQELRNITYLEALAHFLEEAKGHDVELIVELSSNPARTLPSQVMPTFRRLVEHGLAFSFNGLAAGFDALMDTSGLRVRQIKASKGALAETAVEARAAAIIGGMIETCRKLGVQLVATEIETETELGRLRDVGYAYGTGFCFCRAMSFDELHSVLEGNAAERARVPRRGALA